MRDLAYFFAILVIIGWIAVLATMPADNGEPTTQYIAASATLMVGALASWVTAIYVWSKVSREGVLHVVALVMLVLFGFFWGHFYIFASARHLPQTPRTGG